MTVRQSDDSCELVSVLMAVYNTNVQYLQEAINSILSQTYKDIELIIIDDCSDDVDTRNYLDNLKDRRIKVYRNANNEGLTKCLIRGIQLSNGRYIARLDADDVSLPKRIEYQHKCIKKHKCALVGCNWFLIPSRRSHPIGMYRTKAYKIDMIFGNQGPLHSTFFIDKAMILDSEVNYTEEYKTAQDYGFLCDCLSKELKIDFCSTVLIGWREHDNQISRVNMSQQKKDTDTIRRKYISSNFNTKDLDLDFFIKYLDTDAYEKVIDCKHAEMVLDAFMKCNATIIIDMEIHKYWLRQTLKRYIRERKSDFFYTKIFVECMRPDRLVYSLYSFLIERKHMVLELFSL